MAVIVYDEGWAKEYRTQRGDRFQIDPDGNLIVETQYHDQVAIFAKGRWTRAVIVANRDPHGRFMKKPKR